ncbi:thiamine phosphate synthase [Magnetofaba australis]|uniref:Thiamine-phosphate synthase n=1 Tax=Magnetofaba australis IT-1 TaxID=1434232 RepID=A0A1Y2K7W2_9PROT|nr:thiamine phosphate synthase [Magnetofaba australis]OSM06831.1 putative thiamine-phosphate pyrophosphorylase [Magnetofaba australis IT-1]
MDARAVIRGVYPIIDAGWIARSGFDADPREVAAQMAALGVSVTQLRGKGDGGDFHRFAQPWMAALRAAAPGIRVIVNDRVDIALALQADGVHVGQSDLPVAVARQLMGPGKLVGTSTHTPEEIAAAQADGVDSAGFGPIYAPGAKDDPYPVNQGLHKLRDAVTLAGDLPLTAIGGITLQTLPDIAATGVASAAMISDLWRDDWAGRLAQATRLWAQA